MRFQVTSRKFYNQIDNGVNFNENLSVFDTNLAGSVMERKRVILSVEVQLETVGTAVAPLEIHNNNKFVRTSESWIRDGWQTGMSFVVIKDLTTNSPAVKFKGTVTSVNDLEMGFTLSSGSINTQTLDNHQIASFDLPNDLIYKFGIIENNDNISYLSLIDGSEQGYYLKDVQLTESQMTPLGVNRTWQTGSAVAKTYASSAPYVSGENTLKRFDIAHDFVIPYFNQDVIDGIIPQELEQSIFLRLMLE